MKFRFIATSILFALASSTAFSIDWDTPPTSTAIHMVSGATPTSLYVRVKEPNTYAASLQFHEPHKDELKLYDLLGAARKDEKGHWFEAGVPATIRVTLQKRGSPQIVLDRLVQSFPTEAGYKSRWARLENFHLEPGDYQLNVSIQNAEVKLEHLKTVLVFSTAHHGK